MWDVYAMCGHIPTHQCLTCNKPNHSWISRLHTHKNTRVSVQPFSFSLLFSYSQFFLSVRLNCSAWFCLSPENHMVKKYYGLDCSPADKLNVITKTDCITSCCSQICYTCDTGISRTCTPETSAFIHQQWITHRHRFALILSCPYVGPHFVTC